MSKAKDPNRQLLGKIARERGKQFEGRIDTALEYYAMKGFADIEKTPEPMRPLKPYGDRKRGQFVAVYEKKAQPDYKGTLKGGRSIMFEAKFTAADRMEQSRVLEGQANYMTRHQRLGARCYVVIGFQSMEVYRIPWEVWSAMKEHFGRKYVTEADVEKYRVPTAWNGVLMLLD